MQNTLQLAQATIQQVKDNPERIHHMDIVRLALELRQVAVTLARRNDITNLKVFKDGMYELAQFSVDLIKYK